MKRDLHDTSDVQSDLAYWLSRTPEERVAAVDFLRAQFYGPTRRLQRVARVIDRSAYIKNKRGAGRPKDIADIAALGEHA